MNDKTRHICRQCTHFHSEIRKTSKGPQVINTCQLTGKRVLATMCPCSLYQPLPYTREEVRPDAYDEA